ncbi:MULTISPECIES: arsenate reductase family protein [unclassified Clostridioides]|uniref:arsenate reductase family protein n=1 Tax=unclassified Clostridioides TaxID=2635829 RepID=UPI001D0C7582|nr:arsenate reductase family protein [Clostridioides sp. ES-S-0001-02]MCC0639846.1 arsenate reductase family protein [Clostridioides sp. ES-S-0049-03]MCC0653593.1 arsenate reductase family protein [Clostridioides sp. ES-S-0001-03]MCC0655340.1 arsenate reductase family protein [Clostridioides sp. ES-S-0123-01]MCC0671315.1 arsenate reductase family protein [Clostridioides sp. ES-S-0145-01]MCC0674877.1 arsenate reductase family protein [Clostridioides sp. ES-W-0018-02]MCC0679407.1 arsenate reduc
MIKLYGYTKCSTVKKAKKWLKENNLEFEDIDMVQNPPTKNELELIYNISGYDIKKFFNTSGMKYRELGLKDVVKTESDDKLLEILVSDGMLIKRPLLFDGKNVLLGFKEDVWKDILLKEE